MRWMWACLFAAAAAGALPGSAAIGRELDGVEGKTFVLRDVRLRSGAVLPEVRIAYETYGTLSPSRRNAVLLTHGYTSNHHAAGRYAPGKAPPGVPETEEGWWQGLIGPGKPIDTDRFFVVSSNMLGSSYGSTNPASLNPATGKPYGPDFPVLTMEDIVGVQKQLLDGLGVEHLVAVAGPSFGGYQAFQWAVSYPDHMNGIVAAVTAPKGGGGERSVQDLVDRLAQDPNWNGGWYYERGGLPTVLTAMRVATLKQYGIEQQLAGRFPDAAAREEAIRRAAEPWARTFDGHSLVVLRRAAAHLDAEKDFSRIKAKVLYVLSTTDKLFPPSLAPDVMGKLAKAGVDATYFELNSDKGHLATGADAATWAPALRSFMERVAKDGS